MKITIFGATGRVGSAITKKALDDGHFVTAFARHPLKLTLRHERLTVVPGDATDPAAVEHAVAGQDAIISALASSSSKKTAQQRPLTCATRNIINAMRICGVRRLIITSAMVHRQPDDAPDIRFNLLKIIVKLLAPAAFTDTAGAVEAVLASDMDWTIVRMNRASYGAPQGVKAGPVNSAMRIGVTRTDAAAFILKEVLENKYLRQAPALCSRQQKKQAIQEEIV